MARKKATRKRASRPTRARAAAPAKHSDASPAAGSQPAAPRQRGSGSEIIPKPLLRCIKCRSTELKVIKKIGEQPFAGIDAQGNRYTSIIRQRVRCGVCGQVQIAVSRPYHARRWAQK